MSDNISKEIRAVIDAMEDKKGLDITVLDLSSVSDITDHFIICSGTNRSQIQALSDGVEEALAKKGLHHKGIEGYDTANWILLDYGDFVVHVFDKDSRSMYDLERVWGDAGKLEI
ncbi:MAG: ribosome silencing factor [Lachnospiraceae bacterium]|nr:ribosome silencing factor [Lachnospiraceae bacterium]